jgi:predicted Zn-ribbon and HTH transcriptional regulator
MSTKKLTKEQFVNRSKEIHDKKYNYLSVVYINSITKVEIKCNTCNCVWKVTPANHIHNKSGCPQCKANSQIGKTVKSTEEIVNEIKKAHGDNLLYDKLIYKNSNTKVTVGCKTHGYFDKWPNDLKHGSGCPKCSGNSKKTTKEFIAELPIHIKCLDEYTNAKTNMKFKCIEHNYLFNATANGILLGHINCPECVAAKMSKSKFKSGQIPNPMLKSKYELYRKAVWRHTNRTYKKSTLGKRDKQNHLDHMLSIVEGFNKNVPPEVMGSIYNLRIIPAKENQSKSFKSNITSEQLIEAYSKKDS